MIAIAGQIPRARLLCVSLSAPQTLFLIFEGSRMRRWESPRAEVGGICKTKAGRLELSLTPFRLQVSQQAHGVAVGRGRVQ